MTNPHPPESQEPISVGRSALANLLNTFRRRRDESAQVVETRLATAVGQLVDGVTTTDAIRRAKVSWLERPGRGVVPLAEGDWQLLSTAYEIPRLMLDPLRVSTQTCPCFTQRLDALVPLNHTSNMDYGRGARYFAPAAQREGTEEAAFVYLELDPKGESQTHAHPGDELLFVLDGTVEARLENAGLPVRLEKWDYLHFYAEQRHRVRNLGPDTARVFVIRFYQLGRAGTRYELLRELRKTRRDREVTSRAIDEMIALLTPTGLQEETLLTGEVQDRGGLGRLLQLLSAERFRGSGRHLTVRTLAEGLRRLRLDCTHTKVGRMHLGQTSVRAQDLAQFAEVYEVEPLLLYEFLYPALRPAIAVQQSTGYRDVPAHLVAPSLCRYQVPARRLADSDLGVARLILPAGASTPSNRHPGHELVVPLEGRAQIRIDGQRINGQIPEVTTGTDLFAHYTSELAHEVVNPGTESAQVLVVRFYE